MEVPFLVCNFVVMEVAFTKYHGTGNDFIIIDDRKGSIKKKLSRAKIKALCTRRFGIGADGLILLGSSKKEDFSMTYYNADGGVSSMCGNGGRCLVHFAYELNVFKENCSFMAIDGLHEAYVKNDLVHLKMSDTLLPEKVRKDYFLNTGSPHYVQFVEMVDGIDVFKKGQKIRYSTKYAEEGVNVNFVQLDKKGLKVATYERGVEDETYSCGTGVVASALISHYAQKLTSKSISISTKGGRLKVKFKALADRYNEIWLIGPAKVVNTGMIRL